MTNVTTDIPHPRIDIQDPRPVNTPPVLKLVGLGRSLQRRFDAELRELGLTMRHFGVLSHLNRNPELSYSDLARRADVTSQSMNATVRHLEELGAVNRAPARPGLPARLDVTDTGRELLDAARGAAQRLNDQLCADLEENDRHQLNRLLDQLVAQTIAATIASRSSDAEWI